MDPSFAMKAAAWYGAPAIHCPPQYYAGRDQLFRNSERDRAELTELRLKAKPKAHVTTFGGGVGLFPSFRGSFV